MANEGKFRRLQCEQACRKMIEEAGGGGPTIWTLSESQATTLFDESMNLSYSGNITLPFVVHIPSGEHEGTYIFNSLGEGIQAFNIEQTYMQMTNVETATVDENGKLFMEFEISTAP